jgi:hypothetical protein
MPSLRHKFSLLPSSLPSTRLLFIFFLFLLPFVHAPVIHVHTQMSKRREEREASEEDDAKKVARERERERERERRGRRENSEGQQKKKGNKAQVGVRLCVYVNRIGEEWSLIYFKVPTGRNKQIKTA